jgi:hypothetical protein
MLVELENYCTRGWHVGCTKTPFQGVMKRLNEWKKLDDGEKIPAWKCMHCGEKCYAGVNNKRQIVVLPYRRKIAG